MSSIETLSQELVKRGLLSDDAVPPPNLHKSIERPWFVSLVLGCAGWLAGVFGLIFVGLLFKPDGALDFSIAGLLMLAAAYGLYAVDRESAFFDQLALALSIAGQLAITFAAWEATDSAAGTAALVALMQLALLLLMPNRLARTIATFFACIAWVLALRFAWWGEDWFETHRQQVALVPALLGWIVIWVPLIIVTHVLIQSEVLWMARRAQPLARPALAGLLLSLSIGTWASEPFGSLQFWTPPGETYTNWLALWPLLAAATALFSATCAFRLRSRAMVGVGVAGALLHVMQFYFLLGTTLLAKSAIMIGVGVLLSIGAVVMDNTGAAREEADA